MCLCVLPPRTHTHQRLARSVVGQQEGEEGSNSSYKKKQAAWGGGGGAWWWWERGGRACVGLIRQVPLRRPFATKTHPSHTP